MLDMMTPPWVGTAHSLEFEIGPWENILHVQMDVGRTLPVHRRGTDAAEITEWEAADAAGSW